MKENKANEKIKKGLKQALKEIKLINEGKLVGQSARDMIAELKENRGGARAGSGRKSTLKSKYPLEVKKRVTLRLYPTQLKEIESKYGSLQSAVDGL
ncbi:MAG: hypothetical protein K9G49_15045 [Taibaiella sp.]|nr:hypothetical protein [Taibaiella sp.]